MKPPSKPGWYWVRHSRGRQPEIVKVALTSAVFAEVYAVLSDLVVLIPGSDDTSRGIDEIHEWIAEVAPLKRRKK